MAKNSEDLKKNIVALHKDGVGYKKIAKTLKLSCSTVVKTIQRFNRTGSTQNRPRHGRPQKLSARAQHHIQRLCLGNRRMSTASITAEVEGVGVSLSFWTYSLKGVLTFVASGLDINVINVCVLSYFEVTTNVHCTLLYKLYTHYFTL